MCKYTKLLSIITSLEKLILHIDKKKHTYTFIRLLTIVVNETITELSNTYELDLGELKKIGSFINDNKKENVISKTNYIGYISDYLMNIKNEELINALELKLNELAKIC